MIVGTAGHIDHGKTALVGALTGVETDRLREEKSRGISIDLGFAYLPLVGDEVIGFVDVPGHDRFIRNMLAGATGIDFVLLVVAADDGVMPQTREHFEIIRLLGLESGVVAITKCDLVSAERIAEVRTEISALLGESQLAASPVLEVSSITGQGIDVLRTHLCTQIRPNLPTEERLFRLAIDRCFSLDGIGTVVTGPVLSGEINVDDWVILSPRGIKARVRSIHAQGRMVARGEPGERCALNLVGDAVNVQAIERGDMAVAPAAHAPTDRIDAQLEVLTSEPRSLKHWTPVKVYHGAHEVSARVALLQDTPILAGASGRVQLVLDKPVSATVNDRFILRDTTGRRTIGGGRLLDLRGPARKRKSAHRLAALEALSHPAPEAALKTALDVWPWVVDCASFARDRALSDATLERLLTNVSHEKTETGFIISTTIWERLFSSTETALSAFHLRYPYIIGPGIMRLAAQLSPRLQTHIGQSVIDEFIKRGRLGFRGGAVHLPAHRPSLDKEDVPLWQRLGECLGGEHRFRPPQGRECAQKLGAKLPDVRRVLKAQARLKRIVEVAPDRFFLSDALIEMSEIADGIAKDQPDGWITAAQFRDALSNGRKVAIEILEYFDRQGITVRKGDLRRIVTNMEGNRPRWDVRTSNPGEAVSQS